MEGRPKRDVDRARSERVTELVRVLARRQKRRFPGLSFDDLVASGNLAAVLAVKTYDETRGVPFEIFAMKRIRGAMLDLTADTTLNPVAKAVRLAVNERLGDFDMTPPAQLDLEEALEDTQEKARARAVAWLRNQAASMMATALLTQHEGSDRPIGEDAFAERDSYRHAYHHLTELLETIEPQEKILFQRLYREGSEAAAVARELDVSVRTLRRMHASLKEKLAAALRKRGVTSAPSTEGADDG